MRSLIILLFTGLSFQSLPADAQVHDQETQDIIQLLLALDAAKLSDERVLEAANSSFPVMGLARTIHGFPGDALPNDVSVADARAVYQTAHKFMNRLMDNSELADDPGFLLNRYRAKDL